MYTYVDVGGVDGRDDSVARCLPHSLNIVLVFLP